MFRDTATINIFILNTPPPLSPSPLGEGEVFLFLGLVASRLGPKPQGYSMGTLILAPHRTASDEG